MAVSGWQHERGRVASLSRSRGPHDPGLVAARSNLTALRLAEHVHRVIASGNLTTEQRAAVADILTGTGDHR